jgi:hypothetical protein
MNVMPLQEIPVSAFQCAVAQKVKCKVIIRRRTCELVRWRRHILQGPEIMYDTRFLESVEHFMRRFFVKCKKKKKCLS